MPGPLDFITQLDALRRPKVEQKPWMKTKRMEIVTADTLKRVVDECIASGRFGLDLETTGLNNNVFEGSTKDQIVGVCVAPNSDTGYYIPLRHSRGDKNILLSVFIPEFTRLLDSDAVAVFHNAIFDQEFLEYNGSGKSWGNWDLVSRWDDTMFLMYLYDSRSLQRGLKFLSKSLLNQEMFELEELFPADTKERDFSSLDPSEDLVIWYATSDALCTLGLYEFLAPKVIGPGGQAAVYTLEKKCILATRWMQRNRIMIDRPKVAHLIQIGQKEWFASLKELYESVSEKLGRDIKPMYFYLLEKEVASTNGDFGIEADGSYSMLELVKVCQRRADDPGFLREEPFFTLAQRKPNGKYPAEYDAKSPQQLGPMFEELGIPGLAYTEKSKQVKTTKDEIDRIVEENEDLPYIGKVKKFREVEKALTSYLIPMWEDVQKDGSIRANFKQDGTDTGRYSVKVSKDPKNDGASRWPVQGTPSTAKKKLPECSRRIRECIIPRPGMLLFGIDYAGVELRIVTNLSREPMWVNEFFRCGDCGHAFPRPAEGALPVPPPPFCPDCGSDSIGDIHTLTTMAIYGSDVRSRTDFKELRGKSKSVNFALCYGGGGKAVVRAAKVDENEGWRIKHKFDATYKGLKAWWDAQHEFGRRHGYVRTAFGRHYPVEDINLPKKDRVTGMSNGGLISKAERNATNGPVQGSSADITKLAMGLIYQNVRRLGWEGKLNLLITMHDEVVFEIAYDIMEEAVEMIERLMTRNTSLLKMNWPIPYLVDSEFGPDWTVKWNLRDFKYGKKPWPEEIKPYFPKAVALSEGRDVVIEVQAALPATPEVPVLPAPEPQAVVVGETAITPVEAPVTPPVEALVPEKDPLAELSASEPESDGLDALEDATPMDPGGETITGSEAPPVQAAPVVAPVPPKAPPPLIASPSEAKGEIKHVIRGALTAERAQKYAKIIRECVKNGAGKSRLRLMAPGGQEIDWSPTPVMVNEQQFYWLADHYGLA